MVIEHKYILVNEFTSSELIVYVGIALVLLVFNAVFVATEFSLVKLRYTKFGTSKMKEVQESKSVAGLIDDMGASLKVLRFGVSVCSVGIGFLLVPLALSFAQRIEWAGGWELRLAIFLSFSVAVAAHSVLGELVPRALALQFPAQTIKGSVPLVSLFRIVAKPFYMPLNIASGLVLRILRLDPNQDLELLDVEAQIRSLVSDGEELPAMAESIVSNAIEFRKRVAHDIMLPRNQLQYIDLKDSISENLALVRKMGHTRYPMCEADLDHCVGIIHIKDIFRSGKDVQKIDWLKLKRPIIRFSMDESLEVVLQRFLKTKQHFALLTDEYGGTVGAVTLEDVLEELVGEIQDEFDREEDLVVEREGGVFEVDGLTALHDLSDDIGIELKAEEVSTFGGYLTYKLGRMPQSGESFRIGNLEIISTECNERRVLKASVRVLANSEIETDNVSRSLADGSQ